MFDGTDLITRSHQRSIESVTDDENVSLENIASAHSLIPIRIRCRRSPKTAGPVFASRESSFVVRCFSVARESMPLRVMSSRLICGDVYGLVLAWSNSKKSCRSVRSTFTVCDTRLISSTREVTLLQTTFFSFLRTFVSRSMSRWRNKTCGFSFSCFDVNIHIRDSHGIY